MKKRIVILYALLNGIVCSCSSESVATVGNEIPKEQPGENKGEEGNTQVPSWQEGELVIHAINTGRGESMFYVLPDGTTMLVDVAGSLLETDPTSMPTLPKPNSQTSSGKVITDYVNHFMPAKSNGKIDYLLLTHYHEDHIGTLDMNQGKSPYGDLYMSSLVEVGTNFSIKHILDRDYPDYDTPTDMAMQTEKMNNYWKFLEWAKKTNGTIVERFLPGRKEQLALAYEKDGYPDFSIQNIAANGVVWKGNDTLTNNCIPTRKDFEALPKDALPPENILSCVFMLHYGKFDYFAGGDIQYNGRSAYPWKDIESPVADVVSEVEVMKANHHGTANCNSDMLVGKLRPDVMIANIWRDVQPNPTTISRVWGINGHCDVFATNMAEKNKPKFGSDLAKLKSLGGHIVVRVVDRGTKYFVYVLDDNDQQYNVKSSYGPYFTR